VLAGGRARADEPNTPHGDTIGKLLLNHLRTHTAMPDGEGGQSRQ
jgi:hypothetical protein